MMYRCSGLELRRGRFVGLMHRPNAISVREQGDAFMINFGASRSEAPFCAAEARAIQTEMSPGLGEAEARGDALPGHWGKLSGALSTPNTR